MRRRRGDRAVSDIYSATPRLAEPKITPVLEGIYRIQGPIDEFEVVHQKANLDTFPVEKGSASVSQNPLNKPESGTCNLCSAPCSSCSHRNCASSVMKSNIVTGISGGTFIIKEEDSGSCIGGSDTVDKNRACDDHEHTSSETSDLLSSKSLVGEGHGSECRNDDVSCISEIKDASNVAVKKTNRRSESPSSLPGNRVEKMIENEEAVGNLNHATEEGQIGNSKFISHSEESFHERSAGSNLPEAGFSRNSSNDECPPSSGNPEEQDHSEDSKDLPEKDCSQHPDKVPESLTENEKSLPAEKTTDASIDKQAAVHLQQDGTDSKLTNQSELANDRFEKSNLLEDASNVQVTGAQQKTIIEGKPSGEFKDDRVADALEKTTSSEDKSSEEVEDDVKVCDICGDVGQEEKLAVCTRCNDGAEHIYCMRVMMEEVPEGEWLCEECQTEVEAEREKKKLEKSQAKVGVSRAPSLEGKTEKPASTAKHKGSSASDTDAANLSTRGSNKAIQGSNIATKRDDEDPETAVLGRQKLPEPGALSTDVADSRKKMPLSRESSFKMDVEKAKQAAGQMQNSLASNTPKNQAPPVRGPLSKSISFNNSKAPKVKQLVNEVPQKAKNLKESSSSILKKEGPISTLTKSASFKNTNYTEPANKMKSSILLHAEEPRVMKPPMERNMMNNKSTSILGRPSINPSIAVPAPPKADSVAQHLTKGNNIADSNNLGIGQGPSSRNSLGHSELKKPYLAKAPGSLLSNGADRSSGILGSGAQKKSLPMSDPSHRDDKIKDLPSFRQGASGSSRAVRCQRCNEAGHSTQFCAVDKLRMSAVKPLSERNLKDGVGKRNKATEATTSTTSAQASFRSADQSECILKSGHNHNPILKPKDILSTSFNHMKKPPVLDVRTCEQEMRNSLATPISTSAMICNKQKSKDQETPCASRGRTADVTYLVSNELKDKMQILSSQAFEPAVESMASTIPVLEYIWQGGFEVLRTGRSPELCDGFQAHLSSSASPKVLEAANNFPSKVQLEEVPRQNSWPLQFQENGPTDDNIGLFFFARDIQSYENHYSKLIENMLKNDSVLRGNIEAVELLIFPSNLLPKNSQRWNKFYFLWGVFRVRRKDCMKDPPDVCKNECESDLNKDLLVVDQNISVLPSGVPPSQDLHDCARPDPSVNWAACDNPSETERHGCLNNEKSVNQAVGDKPSEDQHDGSFPINSSSKDSSEVPDFLTVFPARKHQKVASSEPEDKVGDSSHGNSGEGILDANSMPTACSVSPNHEEGNESTAGKFNKRETLMDVDRGNENLSANTKQENSRLVDQFSHVSGGTQKRNIEMANWASKADDTKEFKKMKLDNGGPANSSSSEDVRDGRFSSKVHPLAASSVDDSTDNEAMPGSSNSDGKYIFPVDLNAVESTAPGSFINVLSSDDEELPERDAPDLELALGDKKSPKKATLPFLSPRVKEKQAPGDKLPTGSPGSLSLSLAFPVSEKAQASKPGTESEGQLPERTARKKPFPMWDL